MRVHKRILSALLAAALLCALAIPAGAADEAEAQAVTGSISATLRLDYAQRLSALQDREVAVELFRGDLSLGSFPLWKPSSAEMDGGAQAEVGLRSMDGGELGGGDRPGYLDLTVKGLPRGTYTLVFTGRGYTTFRQELELDQYTRGLVLGTGGGAFTLGDVNGDGTVDARDRDAVSDALGSADSADLRRCDLDGDGAIDIVDLAYVNRQMDAAGEAELSEVALLAPPVELDALSASLTAAGTAVSGTLADLFIDNGRTVTLTPAAGGPVTLDIPLASVVEMEEVRILSPEGPGAPVKGTARLEYADGTSEEFSFDYTLPEGIYAIGVTPGSSVVTISLGRRVAVKKVTVTVTQTEGGGYAAVETIQFLKDIVPENPVAPNSVVKGITAEAGDGQVSLKWNPLPNVMGYRIDCWPSSDSTRIKSVQASVSQAVIAGLENLTEYTFTVTPTDAGWAGRPSAPITAVPQPASVPAAPDMVTVGAGDGMLTVSWKASKGADYYQVYCTDQDGAPLSEYRLAADSLTATQTTLENLTNGVTYSIYVTAGNRIGLSGPSRISQGTPAAVRYERPEGIPTEGILDSALISSIRLADQGNYHAPAYTADAPFTPQNMIDGDYRTHWTASTNWSRNEHVVCTFARPVDLSAAFWVPRLDGSFPSYLRAYSVRVWYEGEDLSGEGHLLVPDPVLGGLDNGGTTNAEVGTWPNLPNYSTSAADRFGVLPFGPVTGVVQISLAVEQREYYQVSLSELLFMEYDPAHSLPGDIEALFADELCTQLNPGVTQADIDALRTRLAGPERNYYLNPGALDDDLVLAEELLTQGRSSGVVLEGIDSRSGAADSAKYGQGGSVLQPLGAAARAGDSITVYASGIPAGESVTVYASQYNAEANAWLSEMGGLSNGRNVLSIPKIGSQNTPRGGSLYFSYSGSNPEGIRIHVRRAVDIPVLELADWYELDQQSREAVIGAYVDELAAYVQKTGTANREQNCLNVTEISLPTVLLSLPATAVLDNSGADRAERIERLCSSTLAWEDLMHICKTAQGIDNTYGDNDMESRQNIRYMQMFAGAFMYAAGSHVGIGYGSCGGMVCGKPIESLAPGASANQLFGWGIAHEIGHNMDKLGQAEITNNIYSLLVQTYDGAQGRLTSRLEGGKYPAIFTKTAQQYPGASNDVFVQLGMYWQLHLAYGGADPLEFYNRFFKAWKAGTYTAGAASYDDRVAMTASGVADRDLTEFFTRWGMQLSDAAKAAMAARPAEDRAVWYLSDQSRRARLDGVPAAAGTLAASAVLSGENAVEISIEPNLTGTIQGYEIRRNGRSIAFTTELSYTDVIGSGNHRTFAYEVAAYDILGNETAAAAAGEVRVAYDQTVPQSEYSVYRNDGTVTFDLNALTTISGLKLSGSERPVSGEFTVTVTPEDGAPITARTGSFDQDNQAVDEAESYVTYFWKPGTGGADTRIWSYDAKSVTVTGIPDSTPDSAVQLIRYAGDDVAFLEETAAGVLAEDYRYGDGPDDVIEAGTLIVAGTYRGDPLYLTLKIKGRFTVTAADDDAAEQVEERYLDGYALFFAEIPEDQAVSDISDGIFVFVPNVQREAELQEASRCTGQNLLPSQMKAELSRTDLPDSADSQHVTAETLWINAPGGAELPVIRLEGETP